MAALDALYLLFLCCELAKGRLNLHYHHFPTHPPLPRIHFFLQSFHHFLPLLRRRHLNSTLCGSSRLRVNTNTSQIRQQLLMAYNLCSSHKRNHKNIYILWILMHRKLFCQEVDIVHRCFLLIIMPGLIKCSLMNSATLFSCSGSNSLLCLQYFDPGLY